MLKGRLPVAWSNVGCCVGGLLLSVLVVAGMTDEGEGGVVARFMLLPLLAVGLYLVLRSPFVGARRCADGVRVRGVLRSVVLPLGSVARVATASMDTIPVDYSYVLVVAPDGNEHHLAHLAQYSLVERRWGGIQKKVDLLNLWFGSPGAERGVSE